jgi:hypothetical protein
MVQHDKHGMTQSKGQTHMIISVDAEKVFDKIQKSTSLHDKKKS